MKFYLLILLTVLTAISCKDEPQQPAKEKIKLLILASTGVYLTGTPPPTMQISGTNIETVNNVTGPYILEANYPKGETQTVTLKGNQPDTELYLQISRDGSLNTASQVAYKMGNGNISVSFVAK